jgi:hypothetical protein
VSIDVVVRFHVMMGTLLVYVVFTTDDVKEVDREEATVVEVESSDDAELGGDSSPTPTQYALPSQKFSMQSSETAGFHSKNCSLVRSYFSGMLSQVSPSTTVCHALQLSG